MKASLAVAAARNAISQRDVAGTILHSDYAEDDVKPRNRADAACLQGTGLTFSA